MTADVGVVIRTLNESELIARCLETLQRQRGDYALDVVIVDSGSTDATVEIARAHGARVIDLPPSDFDYSRALNVGIEEARGDLVVSLSAHAIPLDDDWLATMLAPFEDARVAGVSSRQVPWPGAPWQEVHRLGLQFGDERCVYSRGRDSDIVFSNAASAIRRSVWREFPFRLPAAEDLEWAQRVVSAGSLVVYEPGTSVYHSHDESPRAQALRMMDINRVGDDGARTLRRGLREAGGMFLRDSRKIVSLNEPIRRKAAYLFDLLRMVSYYVLDFSRSGTTAERRQAASRDTGRS
jgi:glycosyltransferase involved in cell wall biosynthesis